MGEWFSVSKGKSMISFQSSPDRSDSSGKIRTFVNSTSQERLLPRHQKVCEMNISSCSGTLIDLKSICLSLDWRLPGLSYIRAASMIPSVSTPESWIETVGFVGSSPTRISPTMPAQVRSFWATT